MAKKIGEVIIALVIFSFVVAAFSTFINEADTSEGVSSGIVKAQLRNLSSSTVNVGVQDFQAAIDDTSDVEADPEQQLETRGDSAGGIINILSKNVLVKFLKASSTGLPLFTDLFKLLATLVGVTITILLVRFWRGENKV